MRQRHSDGTDCADQVEQLDLHVRLRIFQITKMLLTAAKAHTDVVEVAPLIRALRADLRAAEELASAAAHGLQQAAPCSPS